MEIAMEIMHTVPASSWRMSLLVIVLATAFIPTVGAAATAQVDAGTSHTLALKSDGSLWAWGYNGYGQIGNGTSSDASPTQIGAGFAHISAGGQHSFAIKEDCSLWAWGGNGYGQLGNSGTAYSVSSPVAVGSGYAAIAAGQYHAVAVQSDGSLWARAIA